MRSRMFAFLLGIIFFWVVPEITLTISNVLQLGLFTLLIIALLLRQKQTIIRIKSSSFKYTGILFIIGFAIAFQQHQFLRFQIDSLPKHTETVTVIGKITKNPRIFKHSTTFEVALEQLNGVEYSFIWRPAVQLNWYYPKQTPPKQGERWAFNVRLKPVHGYRNPGGFDYERWAFSKKIIGKGYVYSKLPATRLTENTGWLPIWREKIARLAESHHFTNSGLIKSLLIGDKTQLSAETRTKLQQSGLAHLLAISGLHIGMVAVLAFLLFSRLWKTSSWLCSRVAAKDAALVFSLMIATLYALLSGWAVPAQRALLMLLIFTLNQLLRLRWTLLNTVLLALVVICAFNPVAILDSSSWLSFGAVLLIVLLLRYQKQSATLMSRIYLWIKFSIMLWLAMLPVTWILFGKIPLLGFVSNILAIPLMSFLIMPLLLLGTFFSLSNSQITVWLWLIADKGLNAIVSISDAMSLFSWQGNFPVEQGFILALVIVLWLLPKALISLFPKTLLTAFVSLWFLTMGNFLSDNKGATLLVFDVGQGLALFWEELDENGETQRVLIDTGYGTKDYQLAHRTWLPYLQQRGITELNAAVISHNDADHAGGLSLLNNEISVSQIYSGQTLKGGVPSINCHDKTSPNLIKTHFRFLHSISLNEVALVKDNNASCVFVIEYQKARILIPGDIESFIEKKLVKTGQLFEVDVVVAPHHGSKTSSSEKFVSEINAKSVIFSTGYLNRFRFPAEKVLNRYRKQGSRIYNTADDGAIRCSWSRDGSFAGCEGVRKSDWGKWRWSQE